MSPTHDFKNIGEVLDFEILKGTITAIDSSTDTCTVDVAGSSCEALIFYHCKPDSIARSNGAIEGAAAGFKIDDEVMVMMSSDSSVVKVIGHIDGVRKCGSFVVFTIKEFVTVWDYVNDCVYNKIPGITFPCLSSDGIFVEWLSSRKDDPDANQLFNINVPCGSTVAIQGNVGCPVLCTDTDEASSSNSMQLVGSCRYWDSYSGSMSFHELRHSVAGGLAGTFYGFSQLPGDGGVAVGTRTKLSEGGTNTLAMPYGPDVEPDASWNDYGNATREWTFYGILTTEPLYLFAGSSGGYGWAIASYGRPYGDGSTYLATYAPLPLGALSKGRFTEPRAVGMYSNNLIVFVTTMVAVPISKTEVNEGYFVPSTVTYGYGTRDISVQAVAQYYQENNGSHGQDYRLLPSNEAINAIIKEMMEMEYVRMELPLDEVVGLDVGIRIVK